MADVRLDEPAQKETRRVRGIGDAGAMGDFGSNLRSVPRAFRDSLVRHGRPTSDRARSQTVFNNFFFHILPVRTHTHTRSR